MKVKIMKNNKLWMEDNAIRQLESIADFKGVESIVGLPDLHMGKQPVGKDSRQREHTSSHNDIYLFSRGYIEYHHIGHKEYKGCTQIPAGYKYEHMKRRNG